MKRKLKIGDSQIVTISDHGIVNIPNNIRMNISEIAELFEVSYSTVKKTIRYTEKQGLIKQYNTDSYVVENQRIYPEYYDLEMIIAIAFQLQSLKVKIFREWILQKVVSPYLNIQALACEKWKNISLN